jgi:hypothetical protein
LAILAATTAGATGFQLGDYFFWLQNIGNGGNGASSGPSFTLPGGPFATSDGALWVKTGSTYALNVQDVNLECDFRTAPDQPTTVITNTCLLSTGVAKYDVNMFGQYPYPGYFQPGESGATPNDPSPYYQQLGQYWLPTMGPTTNFQFDLKFWSGNETSYTAAVAAGENVGDTGWFEAGPTFHDIDLANANTFEYMPSVILQPILAGDANGDGKVDINDLTIVLAHYGQTGMTWSQGEFTGDGTVDINDLTIVLAHYGQSLGASGASIAAVPEPGSLTALLGGLMALVAYAGWPKALRAR